MRIIPPKLRAEFYEPGRNDPCVCGSGIKFKKCCSSSYSSDAAKHFRTAYNQGNYEKALVESRRHFTWYALSHKAHTVPLLEIDHEAGERLLRIDIEALEELLDNLHRCYFHLGRSAEFPSVIDNTRDIVDDPRWADKITYTKGLWHLIDQEDDVAAYEVLAKVDIGSCKDADILSLYLQICTTELTLPSILAIIDRIIQNTTLESVKLQYRVLKAVKYYLVCQKAEGDRILEEAFAQFESLPKERQSTYGRVHLAHALEIYGKAGGRTDALEKAKAGANELIAEAKEHHYTEKYIGDLQRLLGDTQEALGDHKAAQESYTNSVITHSNELTKVFLARALCNDSQIDGARNQLEDIDELALDDPGSFDLAISWALLAARSLRASDIEVARAKMKGVKAKDPIFIQLRDQWTIDLMTFKKASDPGRVRRIIRGLNRWITLNPNLFGIGININKIIDEVDSTIEQEND